jgi:Flp pilus assembly pilin Flp
MDQAMRKYFEYCLISALIAAAAATVMSVIVNRVAG